MVALPLTAYIFGESPSLVDGSKPQKWMEATKGSNGYDPDKAESYLLPHLIPSEDIYTDISIMLFSLPNT